VDFALVDLPACEPGFRPDHVDAQIHRWIASPPMRALVRAYGGEPPAAPVGELLAWLDSFSAAHWDFRRVGRLERHQVRARRFSDAEDALIRSAATALRLADAARPVRPTYDHLLVLGGLGRACLQRTEYAAHLVRDGVVGVPELAALGSLRPLTDDEAGLPALAGADHEMDAMDAGIRIGFDLTGPAENAASDGSWAVRTYRPPGGPEIHVVAAPSSEPSLRRANTPDNYEFWAGWVRLRAADRILVVTSPVYVPFQHCDAIRILALRHGCGVDTIGFDPAHVTVAMAEGWDGGDRYLQEIRSAIRSMRALHEALSGP
jgi:hypothetical protein